jgi:hypothetical protein
MYTTLTLVPINTQLILGMWLDESTSMLVSVYGFYILLINFGIIVLPPCGGRE